MEIEIFFSISFDLKSSSKDFAEFFARFENVEVHERLSQQQMLKINAR